MNTVLVAYEDRYFEALDKVIRRVGREVAPTNAPREACSVEGHADQDRGREHLSSLAHWAMAQQADASLQARIDADPEVMVCGPLIETAIANLLRNARVHGQPPISLTIALADGAAWVHVDDAGPGVPTAQQEAVFERFARGERRRGGLGLGLPLSRQIARRHGGDVRFGRAPDGRSRVSLRLPVAT
jgi:signal transduction histidine kinase